MRSGADPTAFQSQLLQKEEKSELEKAIPKFGSKLGTGGGARADLYSGFDKPSSWRQRAEENLKGPDKIAYRKISSDYRRRLNAVLTIAGAAVQATPPGQRVDIANIPSFTVGEFDRAVERGDMRVGFVILTNKGVTPVTAKDIQNAHDRLWKRRGVPLRNQMR